MQPVQMQVRDTQVYMMIQYYEEKGYDKFKVRKIGDGQFALLVQDSRAPKASAPTPGAVERLNNAALEIIQTEPDNTNWGPHHLELIIRHHEKQGKNRFLVTCIREGIYTVEPLIPQPQPPIPNPEEL